MTTHTSHGRAVLDEMSPLHRELRRAVPEVYKGFASLHHAAFEAGALDVRSVPPDHPPGLLARAGQGIGQQPLDDVPVAQVGDECVDLEVGRVDGRLVVIATVRPEVARPLAATGEEGVGQRADGGC